MTAASDVPVDHREHATATPAVEFRDVRKTYGEKVAVDHVDIDVADGEFLTLLGPSGCGKTTLLSMLAGFVEPDQGSVVIAGQDVTGVPAHRRPVNTVFQDYALFPHMSVIDNVAFGKRMEGVRRRQARAQALEALTAVDLATHAGLRVTALSGGQRQRVALARALIKQPRVLLLDEPFAALDLQLRRRMQRELRSLHRESGTTFVFVTHDQEEAATLSDRIAVLRDGRVEQTGTPEEIYDAPRSRFVAGFIGESNVLDAVVTDTGRLDVTGIAVLPAPRTATELTTGQAVTYALRPERITVSRPGVDAGDAIRVDAVVDEVIRVGEGVKVVVRTDSGTRLDAATSASAERVAVGEQVVASWHPDDGRVLES